MTIRARMLMYGKEASNRKQEIDRHHHTIPNQRSQRPKDKHCGNVHYAAINAWRDRDRRRQREISFEYLTEEKFYPFSTTDKYFIDPCKQYPVTICGQRVILTNGELAEALSSLPEKKREIIYLYFFGRYTQQEIGELYGRCRSTAWHHIHSALQMLHEDMEVIFREES